VDIDSLTPAERVEVQRHYLRVHFARKRRRAFDERKARTKHYDLGGRLVGIGTESCAPRMTSRQEDRAPVEVDDADVPGTCLART